MHLHFQIHLECDSELMKLNWNHHNMITCPFGLQACSGRGCNNMVVTDQQGQ